MRTSQSNSTDWYSAKPMRSLIIRKGTFRDIHLFEISDLSLPIPIPRPRFPVREDNIAASVDGAGFQFGAGAADVEGVGASAAGFSRRALFDRSWRGFLTPHLPRPKVSIGAALSK
jgi:hypothetical protein